MRNLASGDGLRRIDESAIEVHEGHPVDMVLSLHLSPQESKLLNELAKREGTDAVETVRAAIREFAAARPRRAAG